jgi:hypothetical protein
MLQILAKWTTLFGEFEEEKKRNPGTMMKLDNYVLKLPPQIILFIKKN